MMQNEATGQDPKGSPTEAAAQQAVAEEHVCAVCGKPVAPPYNMIGQRVYCDRHFAALDKPNSGFWRSTLVLIVGMGLFGGVVALVAGYIGPLDGPWPVIAGLLLVAVPSALWTWYFYRQDRLEPEPKTRILHVFLFALLLAEVAGYRVVYDLFRVPEWASSLNVASLLASILIEGFTWQVIVYIAVRMVVYPTTEFDERMDGIIYGTMAGLGVATLQNLHYVLDNEGVALGPGVVRIVTTALAQASFGGVLGYFMAQAKFEHKPAWWVPAGLVIAAVLNGLFGWLVTEVSVEGLTVSPWRSLALGLVVALLAFIGLLALMRRSTRATLARPSG